jgi:hypothetical protein
MFGGASEPGGCVRLNASGSFGRLVSSLGLRARGWGVLCELLGAAGIGKSGLLATAAGEARGVAWS